MRNYKPADYREDIEIVENMRDGISENLKKFIVLASKNGTYRGLESVINRDEHVEVFDANGKYLPLRMRETTWTSSHYEWNIHFDYIKKLINKELAEIVSTEIRVEYHINPQKEKEYFGDNVEFGEWVASNPELDLEEGIYVVRGVLTEGLYATNNPAEALRHVGRLLNLISKYQKIPLLVDKDNKVIKS